MLEQIKEFFTKHYNPEGDNDFQDIKENRDIKSSEIIWIILVIVFAIILAIFEAR
jgi:hypothetical protein